MGVFSLKNGFKLAAVFTAVILGAGFASGQELLKYFVQHGLAGIGGLLSGLVFSLVGWAVLDICRKHDLRSFGALARFLLGEKAAVLVEWLVCVFLFVLLSAMIAASGAVARQAFGLSFSAGAVVMAVLCFVVLLFGLKGFVRINIVFMPFMVVGGIFIGLYAFFNQAADAALFTGGRLIPGWALAAGVYASYNLVTGVPVLASASSLSVKPRDAFLGGVFGGGVMTLLGLCLALPLYLHHAQVISVEIPFLVITLQYGSVINGLYLGILLTAVFTTAISNGFALVQWCGERFALHRALSSAVICLLALLAAFVGFSNIVAYVYPIFGFLGLFMIAVILLSWGRKK
jgi:uncharacterized membrane protein YkvI